MRGCKFAYETAGAETRFCGQRAQSHAEGHVNLKMPACMTRERSIAGGRSISKRVSMTSSKLDAVLTSLAPFQGELSIPMQALINLLDGVFLRIT